MTTRHDANRWLRALVSRLDEKYAGVVRLYLEGRTTAEIAEELGIREETARKRLTRAVAKLRPEPRSQT